MKMAILTGLALATLGLGASGGAQAATANGYDFGPAADSCQGALPTLSGALRVRPLGMDNEGSTTVFVTCGATGTDLTFGKTISRYFIRVANSAATAQTITCTFVHGYVGATSNATPVYVTRTAPVPAGALQFLDITPADLGAGAPLRFPQASCSLPPGTQLLFTGVEYTYEIGS